MSTSGRLTGKEAIKVCEDLKLTRINETDKWKSRYAPMEIDLRSQALEMEQTKRRGTIQSIFARLRDESGDTTLLDPKYRRFANIHPDTYPPMDSNVYDNEDNNDDDDDGSYSDEDSSLNSEELGGKEADEELIMSSQIAAQYSSKGGNDDGDGGIIGVGDDDADKEEVDIEQMLQDEEDDDEVSYW